METKINLKSKFTIDSFFTIIAIIIIGISGLWINVLVQDSFYKEGLGLFSYTLSIFFITNSIGTLGLNRAMVFFSSYYADNKSYRNQLITNSLILVSIWSTILVFGLNILLDNFFCKSLNSEQCSYISVISFSIPFYCLNNVAIAVLNGVRAMKIYSFIRSSRWALLILCMTFISTRNSLGLIFYSFVITEMGLCCIMLFIFIKNKYISGFYNKKSMLEILRYSKYVYPSQILVSFNEHIDIIIIENFVSAGSLGVYSFSSKVAKSLSLIGGAIQTNVNPIISRYFKKSEFEKLKIFCKKLKGFSLIFFSILIILSSIFYYFLIGAYIKDDSYYATFNYYIFQCVSVGLYSAFIWSGGMLIMTGKIKENIWRVIVKLILNIVVMLICIIVFPAESGMYIGFCIVMISHLYIDKYFISKHLGINIF